MKKEKEKNKKKKQKTKNEKQKTKNEAPNDIELDPFPDPVSHFGAPWRPFWIFQFLIEGVLGSKNLFSKSCLKWPHY